MSGDMLNRGLLIIKKTTKTTLEKIYDERVTDWIEDGMILNYQRQKHREKYRKKICETSCSIQQKIKRNCIIINNKTNKRSCGHMERAVLQKFLVKSKIHSSSHPYYLHVNTTNNTIEVS